MSDRFRELLFRPQTAADVAVIRIVVFGFFAFKLLSRSFSEFGDMPAEVMGLYPSQLYSESAGYFRLGLPWLVDLATFHWVHWLLPLPGRGVLAAVDAMATVACLAVVFFGRGPRHVFAVSAYVLTAYLWGFCWRSGADVDAVFLPMQLALLYVFFREPEAVIVGERTPPMTASKGNGWFYSMVLMAFVIYYLYAGLNKLIDISFTDWFDYDLVGELGKAYDLKRVGYFHSIAPGLHHLRNLTFLNSLLVPLAYILELTIPVIFFRRRWIPAYMVMFIAFHLMTWGVGILFLGNILIWLCLVPWYRLVPAWRPAAGLVVREENG